MVTPHLPPDQAANALLPHSLGQELVARGHAVRYLTFGGRPDTHDITYVKRRRALRVTRFPQALEALDTWRKCGPLVRDADVVHIHSNTWMNQVAAAVARRTRRPYVLTHYGTEIWHHDGKDLRFRRLNEKAAHVAFYSQALLARARELELPMPRAAVGYPPVTSVFRSPTAAERDAKRRALAPSAGLLLVNVKRLHPLADQATLLDAFALVRAKRADARLLIAGSGECEAPLRAQAERLGLGGSARLLGLLPNPEIAAVVAAADLFVLSSVLEATPTVALEALACGTPVVSTDNPGGVELHGLFGDDIRVVTKQDARALAQAILAFAGARRRTLPASASLIESRFRLKGAADAYLALYREALG